MKIVHVPRRMTAARWGGTETVVAALAAGQCAAGHAVEIHTSQALDPEARGLIAGVAVQRHRHHYPWLHVPATTRRRMDEVGGNLYSFSLDRTLGRLATDTDIFHVHTGKRMAGQVRRAALKAGRPYVVTLHGGLAGVGSDGRPAQVSPPAGEPAHAQPWGEWGKVLGWRVGSRRVLHDAAAVVYLDPADAPLLRARGVTTGVHLPNGVDATRFSSGDGRRFRAHLSLPADARLVSVVGRIDAQKNQLLAVEAMPRWLQRHPSLHLALVGPVTDPAYHDVLERAIADRGLAQRVHLVHDLAPSDPLLVDAYTASDALLVPSVHEPFGVVILEAWAAGTPVIAHAVGGIPTFVNPRRDGVLVEPGSPRAWDEALDGVLGGGTRVVARIAEGRRRVRHEFDWSRIVERTLALYDDVLSGHRRAA